MDFASCTSSNVCVFARVLVCKLLGGSCHFQFCGLQVLSRLLLSICYSFRNLKQFGALASFKVEIRISRQGWGCAHWKSCRNTQKSLGDHDPHGSCHPRPQTSFSGPAPLWFWVLEFYFHNLESKQVPIIGCCHRIYDHPGTLRGQRINSVKCCPKPWQRMHIYPCYLRCFLVPLRAVLSVTLGFQFFLVDVMVSELWENNKC